MKKIIYSLIIVFAASVILTACKKDFLQTYPTDSVAAATVTATTDNMMASLNGIHRALYVRYTGTQGNGGIGSFWIVSDCMGEDHVVNAEQWYNQVYKWTAGSNATYYYNTFPWRMFYQWISNANILINGAENAVGPEADKNSVLGQALVYRAWSHYYLVQLYANRYVPGGANAQLGVPYMSENLEEGIARHTVAEVYTKIMADLDAAIAILGSSRPNKSHMNKDVAKGVKARVALTMGNYALAASLSNEVKAGYDLMDFDTYKAGFRVESQSIDEFLWASQIISIDQNDKWAAYGAYISRNFSSSAIRGNPRSISSFLYEKISDTDVRKTLFSKDGQHANLQSGANLLSSHSRHPYTNQKFIAVSNSDSRVDVPLLRVAELYLNEAEALARTGDDAGAAEVLYDLVVTRDPDYTLSTNTGDDLIEEILFQRRVELWGEGFRFFDLKRLDMPLDRRDQDGVATNHTNSLTSNFMYLEAGSKLWTWVIPQDEMDANPLMVQNEI